MARLRGKRSQVDFPGIKVRRVLRREPKAESHGRDLRWYVDVTALLASIATVVTLIVLIHDRRDQANIAAWTLLQTYLQQENRPRFNEGQNFALETLADHQVLLDHLDAHDAVIEEANLHYLVGPNASFERVTMTNVNLSSAKLDRTNFKRAHAQKIDLADSSLYGANLEHAEIALCNCQGTNFSATNLRGAEIWLSNLSKANFSDADISDLRVVGDRWNEDVFETACYRPGHPPTSVIDLKKILPAHPQSKDCMDKWGIDWTAPKAL